MTCWNCGLVQYNYGMFNYFLERLYGMCMTDCTWIIFFHEGKALERGCGGSPLIRKLCNRTFFLVLVDSSKKIYLHYLR